MSETLPPASNADKYANPIPEAIRRQSRRVDQIARDMKMANAPPEEVPPVPAADTPPTTVVQPVADTSVAKPVQPAPVVPTPTEDWEQKYRTLQGMMNSETGSLRTQISSLERVIAAIQPREPAPAAHTPATTVAEVPKEDVDTFGDDLVAASRRWARAEFAGTVKELQEEIRTLRGETATIKTSQQQSVQSSAQNHVMMNLDKDPLLGSTWRVTNTDPAFWRDWLGQPDPFSGQPRNELIRNAFAAGDFPRVAAFFRAYASEHTGSQQPVPIATQTTPVEGRPTLEELAAPGQGTGHVQPGAPAEKRIWSAQNITAFYRDVQRGVFQGRDADKLRLEQDIIAATREGRIK